jgi:hypothetical protein
MKSVIVIGAGHIGAVIAEELSVTRNYQVTLTDLDKTISVHLRVGALPLFLFPTNALKYNLTWSTWVSKKRSLEKSWHGGDIGMQEAWLFSGVTCVSVLSTGRGRLSQTIIKAERLNELVILPDSFNVVKSFWHLEQVTQCSGSRFRRRKKPFSFLSSYLSNTHFDLLWANKQVAKSG